MQSGRTSCCVASVSENEPVEAPTPCRQCPAMIGCVTAGGTRPLGAVREDMAMASVL